MSTPRWLLAVPLTLAATFGVPGGTARAASVRDTAGLFSKEAVAKANRVLSQIQGEFDLNTNIETIPTRNGEDVRDLTSRLAKEASDEGLFVLIVKKEKDIRILASRPYSKTMGPREIKIRDAFGAEFRKGDFDAGLLAGVDAIKTEASSAKAEFGALADPQRPIARGRAGIPARGRVAMNRGGGFGLGGLMMLALGIFAVMFVIRALGSMFGGGMHAGPGMRMGGPGYGGGYGGGGGGFMSGLFGGIGGALAGNWLYDQFSGRHGGGYSDAGNYDAGGQPDATGGDDWSGGTGTSGNWGDSGGGGGGDWGGGGGGDWGGGGGDGGGGGGDW